VLLDISNLMACEFPQLENIAKRLVIEQIVFIAATKWVTDLMLEGDVSKLYAILKRGQRYFTRVAEQLVKREMPIGLPLFTAGRLNN
jgi:rRNA maturation protein Rpf1